MTTIYLSLVLICHKMNSSIDLGTGDVTPMAFENVFCNSNSISNNTDKHEGTGITRKPDKKTFEKIIGLRPLQIEK